MINWFLIGLIAGSCANMMKPHGDRKRWLQSLLVGVIGSFCGGLVYKALNIESTKFQLSIFIPILGALVGLFLYYKFRKRLKK